MQLIDKQIKDNLIKIAEFLNIDKDDSAIKHLEIKLKPILQEYSLKVFKMSDEFKNEFLERSKLILENYNDDEDEDYYELLTESVQSDDFEAFVKSLHKIVLHMKLSDPQITIAIEDYKTKISKDYSNITQKYQFMKFK